MATRQYIGARYVPKFYQNSVDGSTQWEPNVVYEPLMWVTLTNSHMYISKKQVPATIGSPVNNIEYWLDVGSYNGIIEQLREDVDALDTRLTSDEAAITALDTRLTSAETTISTHSDSITALVNRMIAAEAAITHNRNTSADEKHQVLIISDSYGDGYSPDGNTTPFPDIFQTAMGDALTFFAKSSVGGAGLLGDQYNRETFYNILVAASASIGNKSDITDIIFCGFANDALYTDLSVVATRLSQIVTYCKTNYPNAKIWVSPVGWCNLPATSNKNYDFMCRLSDAAAALGVLYTKGLDLTLHRTDLMSSDGLHPNQAGQTYIGEGLATILRGGSVKWLDEGLASFTPSATFEGTNDNFHVFRDDEEITIYKNTAYHWVPAGGGVAVNMNPSFQLIVGTINSPFVNGNGIDSATVNCLMMIDGRYYQFPMQVAVFNKSLVLSGSAITTDGSNYLSGVCTDIQVPQFTLKVNAYH